MKHRLEFSVMKNVILVHSFLQTDKQFRKFVMGVAIQR